MEGKNKAKDDERRDSEQQLLQAEEMRRTLEVKLAEAQRRSEWQRDTERQIQENERARLDYLNEIKRRAEEEKRLLEMEMLRLQDDLRSERASRVEAEAREASLRSDFQRLADHRTSEMRSSGDIKISGATISSSYVPPSNPSSFPS